MTSNPIRAAIEQLRASETVALIELLEALESWDAAEAGNDVEDYVQAVMRLRAKAARALATAITRRPE